MPRIWLSFKYGRVDRTGKGRWKRYFQGIATIRTRQMCRCHLGRFKALSHTAFVRENRGDALGYIYRSSRGPSGADTAGEGEGWQGEVLSESVMLMMMESCTPQSTLGNARIYIKDCTSRGT